MRILIPPPATVTFRGTATLSASVADLGTQDDTGEFHRGCRVVARDGVYPHKGLAAVVNGLAFRPRKLRGLPCEYVFALAPGHGNATVGMIAAEGGPSVEHLYVEISPLVRGEFEVEVLEVPRPLHSHALAAQNGRLEMGHGPPAAARVEFLEQGREVLGRLVPALGQPDDSAPALRPGEAPV